MGIAASPKRPMPRLSPSASRMAWPITMPTSSTVWWSSTQVSPFARTVRSHSEWRPSALSMWSKKPTPVSTSQAPLPSRSIVTLMSVSLVLRSTVARLIARPPLESGSTSPR